MCWVSARSAHSNTHWHNCVRTDTSTHVCAHLSVLLFVSGCNYHRWQIQLVMGCYLPIQPKWFAWCTPAVYWGRVGRGNKCAFGAQVVSLHNDLEQQMHQLLLSEGTAGNTFHAFFFLNKTLRKTHFKTVAWSLKAALFIHCIRAFLNPAGKTEVLKVILTFSYFWSNI